MRATKMKFAVGIAAGFVAGIVFVVACGKSRRVGRDAGMDVGGARDVVTERDAATGHDAARDVATRDAAEDRGFLDVLRDVLGIDAQDARAQDAPCMQWQIVGTPISGVPTTDPRMFVNGGDVRLVDAGWEPIAGGSSDVLLRRCVR